MYEKLIFCPVCHSENIANSLICKDYTVSQESFAISVCNTCSLKFTNPRPSPQNISKYYESDSYISHTNSSKYLIDYLYKIVRNYTLQSKYKLIIHHQTQKGKIMDFGCGTGHFLNKMRKEHWEVMGIEPNEQARNYCLMNGLPVNEGINSLALDSKYDTITLWHVLEHLHQPVEILQTLKNKLATNGMMYVAVPNEKSFDAEHYKECWAAYDVPRHLSHYNQQSFQKLIKTSKLKIHKVIPMKFDSFYVSMLSEKYKNGTNNYINAIKVGYKSNIWAKQNNNNFSSLIYIIKK